MLVFDKNGELFLEHVKISDIAEFYGTSTYIYSKKKIIDNFYSYKNYSKFKKMIICFACKTNSNRSILNILASLGAGADTTSGGEIYRCINAGFNPNKIVYAGVGKTKDEIEYALKNNIFMFNVESLEELETIDNTAGKLGVKARISFRINPDVDPDTHSYIVTGKKGTKFGIPYEEAENAYLIANTKKNIKIAGIHFHIGSQITNIKPFELAAKKIKKIVDIIEKNKIKISYVNCGGGLGIQYSKTSVSSEEILTPKLLIDTMFTIFNDKTLIFEPGRSIMANAGYLLTKVIYRKNIINNNKRFIIVDAGMNDLIRPALYGAYHDIIPVKNHGNNLKNNVLTDIVGPICENSDFIGKDRILPVLSQNDLLLVTCAGAYGSAMSSTYNSRPLLAEVLVDNDSLILIRKRGNYSDLTSNEIYLKKRINK
ncbi:MAG: diaminopimelate decarboxylase [Endomicrobium sp.]|jgi:diaminopimelate decarboxylase|nr:diaminopimelate decarboxylase [Endomicrobium sp.]